MADWGAAGAGALSGASTGASVAGPWGAVIGGVVGGAAGLLGGKKKAKPIYSSLGIKTSGEAFLDALNANRATNQGDLSNYSAAIAAANPVAAALAKQQSDTLGQIIARSQGNDPFNNQLSLLEGTTNNLKGLIPDILGSTRRERGLRLAGLGITSPTSTYNDRADLAQLGASLGPILNTIYGNVGMDTGRNEAARLAGINQTVNLMDTQANLPYAAAERYLLPGQARDEALAAQISQLGALGGILKSNVAGYNVDQSAWANALEGAMGGAAYGKAMTTPATNRNAGGMTMADVMALMGMTQGGAGGAYGANYGAPGGFETGQPMSYQMTPQIAQLAQIFGSN